MELVEGLKSKVSYGDEVIHKVYKPFGDDRAALRAVHDIFLAVDSDPKKSRNAKSIEEGILRAASAHIPRGELLVPFYYGGSKGSANPKYVEMELIGRREHGKEDTYHEQILGAIDDPLAAITPLPLALAALHNQLNYQRARDGRLMQDVLCQQVPSLASRSYKVQRDRLEHYLCIMAYSLSPDLTDLAEECRRKRMGTETTTSQRVETTDLRRRMDGVRSFFIGAIKKYLDNQLGRSTQEFIDDIIDRDFTIKFGSSPRFNAKGQYTLDELRSLREQGRMLIIHGDFNPRHIFVNGRSIDFDEARLGCSEVDVSSGIYSMYLFPRGESFNRNTQELALLKLCLDGYFEPMIEYKAAAGLIDPKKMDLKKEKINFTIRLGEARLMEMIRLIAVTCKTPNKNLSAFTSGHPAYDKLEGTELRSRILKDCFTEGGLLPFLEFWGQREGLRFLKQSESPHLAQLFYQQLSAVEKLLDKSGILKGGLDQGTLKSLEALVC